MENKLQPMLERLGQLHDASVTMFVWNQQTRMLRFEIEDFYCNFRGLPEYPGRYPGAIELHNVEDVIIDIENRENRLDVYEFSVSEIAGSNGSYRASISFWPSGKVTANFGKAVFPFVELLSLSGNGS